ncbi:hypothetical protein J0S82_010151 [Galemys pyrenaicus]|uniref:Uncharacterized protein n=1 Tax=Galemys pyrenaicus TaxID=202257 RepID=A0A8J6DW30_GALPY|nr:hypothetical protein J0S82_010151 [Galemys pyrenaicus]
MKWRPHVVKLQPKLRRTLSTAQPVTARSPSDALSPLDSTQLPAVPPTAHRLIKPHPSPQPFHRKCATALHKGSWVTKSAAPTDPKGRTRRPSPEKETLLKAMHPGQ